MLIPPFLSETNDGQYTDRESRNYHIFLWPSQLFQGSDLMLGMEVLDVIETGQLPSYNKLSPYLETSNILIQVLFFTQRLSLATQDEITQCAYILLNGTFINPGHTASMKQIQQKYSVKHNYFSIMGIKSQCHMTRSSWQLDSGFIMSAY